MPELSDLAEQFALLSLVAFGGGNATLPEMHRLVVESNAWMSNSEFAELFALAQAAPGPNILVVSLIGLHIAGITGFLAVTLAFCIPTSLLMYGVARWWQKAGESTWRNGFQEVVGGLAAGLVFASGCLIAVNVGADSHWQILILVVCTVLFALRVTWNPLWLILIGAMLGFFDFI